MADMKAANAAYENLEASQIKNFKDFLISYNKLSELCFNDCISDFTGRSVRSDEERCAINCAEKFLKANQRISERFQEFQIMTSENLTQKGMLPS